LSRILGGGHVDLNITSAAAGSPGAPLTRHYEFASQLIADVIEARIAGGIHFRTADVVASRLGAKVADWALNHEF
jgi:hypothetical protein